MILDVCHGRATDCSKDLVEECRSVSFLYWALKYYALCMELCEQMSFMSVKTFERLISPRGHEVWNTRPRDSNESIIAIRLSMRDTKTILLLSIAQPRWNAEDVHLKLLLNPEQTVLWVWTCGY